MYDTGWLRRVCVVSERSLYIAYIRTIRTSSAEKNGGLSRRPPAATCRHLSKVIGRLSHDGILRLLILRGYLEAFAIIAMGRVCCVLGCPSGGDAPSHQIPKNPVLFREWKSIIYSEKIQHLTDEQISKCAVCYRHFADDDYLVTFRVRKLKRGIAPSLNLPNKPESQRTAMKVPDTSQIALFEDTPGEDEFCLLNRSRQTSPEKYTEQCNPTSETLKLNRREKMSRRKRVKLTTKQLPLLQRKKQAKQYEKTSTIQKLLSFLTPAELASIKTRIRKTKYSPRVYVKVYHDIAMRKALGQI